MIITHRFRIVAHTMIFMGMATEAARIARSRRVFAASIGGWYAANIQAERAQQIAAVATTTYAQRRDELLGQLPAWIRSN